MNKKITFIVSLLVVIVGACAWLYYTPPGDVPKTDLDIYQALGTVTAKETAKLLDNQGELVVISWDSSRNKMPVIEAQITSFERAIKQHKGIQITTREKVLQIPAQMMATGGGMPSDQFLKVVKAHPRAGAIVLFLAFPNLSSQELKELSEGQTKFVVVSGCNPGYKKLLMDRNIDLAIVPRFDRIKNTRPPQTVQESFDQNYQIVTSDQAATLPY